MDLQGRTVVITGAARGIGAHLATALAGEVAHLGVTVGAAHPSWVDTDMVRDAEQDLASFRELVTRRIVPRMEQEVEELGRSTSARVAAISDRPTANRS